MKKFLSLILMVTIIIGILSYFSASALAATSSDYEIEVIDSSNRTAEIKSYNGYGGHVVIPSILNGYKIIKVGDYAFSNNSTLTALTIPSSVKDIGIWVCNNCDNLTEINIPEGVITIGGHSFSSCELLNKVTIPSTVKYISVDNGGTYMGDEFYCFQYCESLTSIEVDANNINYSSIDGVLYNKEHTRLLIYPDGKKDESFRIPDGVSCIEESAFDEAHYLTEVIMPCSVQKIRYMAFIGCDNLNSMIMSKNIRMIDTWAFVNCDKFKNIYYESNYENWKNIMFNTETNNYEDTLSNAEVYFNNTKNINLHNILNKWSYNNRFHWKQCSCGINIIDKEEHHFLTNINKASVSNDGNIVKTCKCEKTEKEPIYRPTNFALSHYTYSYTGKVKNPSVTIKDSKGNTLIQGADYTVKYSNNKKVGTATVTINFKGNYNGSKKLTFKINPKGTTASKVTSPKSKQIKVTWKKQATQTTGYQIQYSTNKDFKKGNKTVNIKNNKTTSTIVKKLEAKKKYYVRIRTYKIVSGKKYYSSWSKAKTVTTKK